MNNGQAQTLLMMYLKQAHKKPLQARVELLEMLQILAGINELIHGIEYHVKLQATAEKDEQRYTIAQDIGTLHTQAGRLVYLATQLGTLQTEGGNQ